MAGCVCYSTLMLIYIRNLYCVLWLFKVLVCLCVFLYTKIVLLFYLLQGLTITGMYMYIALSEICDDVLECAVLLLPMSSYMLLLCYGSPAGVRMKWEIL